MNKSKWIVFAAILLRSTMALAQTDTTWFNTNWNVTDKAHAQYYRTPLIDSNGLFYATDHFLNGNIQMSGSYTNKSGSIREGYFVHYDSSGLVTYEGRHHNGNREGEWKYYFSGLSKIRSIITYQTDIRSGLCIAYDSTTGIKIVEGNCCGGAKCGIWKYYYQKSGALRMEINQNAGKYDGMLKVYYENGKLRREDKYEAGQFVSGKCYAPNGEKIKHMPYWEGAKFKGDLADFIKKCAKYPEEARQKGIIGSVELRFTVLEDGNINNIQILHHLGGGCDEEAERIVRLMPSWIPAKHDGEPCKYNVIIAISFPQYRAVETGYLVEED